VRLSVFTLLFSLVAALHTVIPTQAEAASALFRAKRTWWGGGAPTTSGTASPYISPDYHPRLRGPSRTANPAIACVAHTPSSDHDFTIPSNVIKEYTRSFACPTFMDCRPGYPVSVSYHSYYNVKGHFRPSNPYGASSTTTVAFPTTGNGEPTSPTTDFGGRYDFSRSGSIMITPGANHFGGTMKFFNGPNHHYYQYKTVYYPYISKAYGIAPSDQHTTSHETKVGEVIVGRRLDRYRITPSGYNKLTTGPPGYEYYVQQVQEISTVAPWTTGVVQAITSTAFPFTVFGYDNRNPYNGLSGVTSLVRPRLVHTYVVPHDPNLPIIKARSFAQIWQMKVHSKGSAALDVDYDGVQDALDNCSIAVNTAQDDTDADGYGNICDADYDNSGIVGFPDFGQFVGAFAGTDMEKCHIEPIPGCIVGFPDFGAFVEMFGSSPGPGPAETTCP
jgi:hypothetical protein